MSDSETRAKETEQSSPQRKRHIDLSQAPLLGLVIETAPDGVIIIDDEGMIISFSPAAEKLFGYRASEVLGKNVSILMPSPYREHHDAYLRRYRETGERRLSGSSREVVGRKKNGDVFPIELAVGEVQLSDTRIFTGFVRDLTARRKFEKRISELQDELVHVARHSAMGELATTLAHELNQPLTAIANYAQAARRLIAAENETAREKALDFMGRVADQAKRAGEIIWRLRQFVKHHEVERRWEDPCEAVTEAAQIGSLGASAKGIDVRIQCEDDVPDAFMDRIQIQQVVTNLVRNAVDALDGWEGEKRITVTVSRHDEDDVMVTVSDTGPGIAPEIERKLFQPFNTSKKEGVGIGLAVSQTILDAHNGRIWGRNKPEGGAIFRFILPRAEKTEENV